MILLAFSIFLLAIVLMVGFIAFTSNNAIISAHAADKALAQHCVNKQSKLWGG